MKLELIDTAYMKDQQIKILKKALLATLMPYKTGDDRPIEHNAKVHRAVGAAFKIEQEWNREVA